MNAGDMDREIEVITGVRSQEGNTGEEVYDFGAAAESITVWAEWLPGATREAYQAQQRLGSYIEGVFRTYDIDPRPAPERTRIRFDGRMYDVKPVVEIGRGEGLLIPVVAAGESVQ